MYRILGIIQQQNIIKKIKETTMKIVWNINRCLEIYGTFHELQNIEDMATVNSRDEK